MCGWKGKLAEIKLQRVAILLMMKNKAIGKEPLFKVRTTLHEHEFFLFSVILGHCASYYLLHNMLKFTVGALISIQDVINVMTNLAITRLHMEHMCFLFFISFLFWLPSFIWCSLYCLWKHHQWQILGNVTKFLSICSVISTWQKKVPQSIPSLIFRDIRHQPEACSVLCNTLSTFFPKRFF